MDVHAETIQSNSVYFMGIASSGKLMKLQWIVDAETRAATAPHEGRGGVFEGLGP